MSGTSATERARPLVLVVDDEPAFLRLVALELRVADMHSVVAHDIEEGLRLTREEQPNVILIDHLLPGGPGLQRIPEFRALCEAPLILMSAAQSEGLLPDAIELADDFLSKPFLMEDLIPRVQYLLGMPGSGRLSTTLRHGKLTIDFSIRTATRDGKRLLLSRTDWLLLEELAITPGDARFDQELLVKVWGARQRYDSAFLAAYVERVCNRLGLVGRASIIERFRNVGYRLTVGTED